MRACAVVHDDEVAPVIDPELNEYVNRFVEAASQRGITISLTNLEVKFEDVSNSCGEGLVEPRLVKIDPSCWSNLPDIPRELLMFHELGHTILKRTHDHSTLPNGDYKSIMTEDPTTLYNEYTPEKRVYYLDELFGVVTSLPKWTSVKTIETVVLMDEVTVNDPWHYTVSGAANHQGGLVDSVFSSPDYSLAIHSDGVASGYSYWSYSFVPQGIEVGSEVVLKVKIKAMSLTGGGAFFALRLDVDEKDYPIFFSTTQQDPVKGTTEFGSSTYSITMKYYPNKVDALRIFLFLDGTSTGTVFFDDIQLLKYQ